jgi:hypothetical protein
MLRVVGALGEVLPQESIGVLVGSSPAARPVGCDPRWGARAARASDRGLVYTMQVINHKSWGGYPGGRMLKILFRIGVEQVRPGPRWSRSTRRPGGADGPLSGVRRTLVLPQAPPDPIGAYWVGHFDVSSDEAPKTTLPRARPWRLP